MSVSEKAPVVVDQRSSAPPAVLVEVLSVRFGDVCAVDGVSFQVRAGEIFGLLGPHGAGKTTTIRVLTTLLPPQAGRASIFGLNVGRESMAVRQSIGYVPQQLSIDSALTGWENVWLFARLFDVPRRERKERIDEALDTVGLGDAANRLAKTYSGGRVRRLELAQALINRPRLLIMDEPTIGLDPVARSDVWDRVESLRHDYGMTVLVTTHYMDEADALCHRLAIMHRGVIRAEGTPAELKESIGPEATLLITGKAFAAGIRGLAQVIVILIFSAILRVGLDWNPLHLLGAALVVVISAGFFACLSMVLAGIVMSRESLMGIGQAITMPLFFASSALYPVALMPGWVQALTGINPLTYEVEALRGLLLGTPTNLPLDFAVLLLTLIAGITAAAALLGRLARG